MMLFYIGCDEREKEAYEVCRRSILNHAPDTVVVPLWHRQLRKQGLFWREWRIDGDGQYWDVTDGKPFSTQFSHSRFLTPHLARRDYPQAKWAAFVDCDFLFRRNVAELFAAAKPDCAVMCVKHDQPATGGKKMDGMRQTSYARKNWSSLMLFNVRHEANARLTTECVNEADGSWLHQFGWLNDDQIGALPRGWNHLVGIDDPANAVNAAHFTLGGPWFEEWPISRFDLEWLATHKQVRNASTPDLRAAQ